MRNGNTPEPQRPLRLSIITQFYPPDYAATGQLIEELAFQLVDQGVQIQVFTGQPGYAYQKQSAPAIEQSQHLLIQRSRTSNLWPQRIRGKALNGLMFCLRSALHLVRNRRAKDALLVTTAPPYLPVLGYLANWLFGTPYICLLYDLYPDVAVELGVLPASHWLPRLWNWVNQQVWHRAHALIVLSSSMKNRIVERYPELTDKIAVIHSWANPNWIVPLAKPANWFAQEHNLEKRFTVLYSGNMGRCHDMDTILATIQELRDEPIQFVFIGGGAKRKAFMEQVEQLKLSNCLFLPYQDKQVLPYSLTACDLSLVSIGAGMEGLIAPSKFYGSLAAGRPIAVICEPHSYLRGIVAAAGCGDTFNLGDSQGLADFIRLLAEDPGLVEEMGRAGRCYMERHFTPEIIARQYFQVLQQSVHPNLTSLEVYPEREPSIDRHASIHSSPVSRKLGIAQRFMNWRKSKMLL
jgi:glycosyltransferase involved in cell wall biosynthesis